MDHDYYARFCPMDLDFADSARSCQIYQIWAFQDGSSTKDVGETNNI